MGRREILRLVAGFRRFRDRYFVGEEALYQRLSTGQTPKTLVIACSDSRVDPALLTDASPGELFVVRNVANLVPPCDPGRGVHGVSAAIEFAVKSLKVEHVVILGHRQCGGIRALMSDAAKESDEFMFIGKWMKIAQPAKERVLARHQGEDFEALCQHCEMQSIASSIENLKTFPFVRQAIEERGLELIGIYFDLEKGELYEMAADGDSFAPVDITARA
jgi:carbonic anhydrase